MPKQAALEVERQVIALGPRRHVGVLSQGGDVVGARAYQLGIETQRRRRPPDRRQQPRQLALDLGPRPQRHRLSVSHDRRVQPALTPQGSGIFDLGAEVPGVAFQVVGEQTARRQRFVRADSGQILGPEPLRRPARYGPPHRGRRRRRERRLDHRVLELALREVELQQKALREEAEDEQKQQTERCDGEHGESLPVGPAGEFSHLTARLPPASAPDPWGPCTHRPRPS